MIALDKVATKVIICSNNLGDAYISIETEVGLKDLMQSYVLNVKRKNTHTYIYICSILIIK